MITPNLLKKQRICFVLLLFLLINLIEAQNILSLDDAIKIGLQNNFQIQILESNEQIARNNNNPANAEFLPTLSTIATINYSTNNTQQQFFNGESRSATGAGSQNARAGAEANWMIFDGFRRQAIKETLALEETRTSELTRSEALLLVEQIELAYFQLGQIQEEINLTLSSIELNQSIVTLARQKQRIGVGSESEVLQASSQLNTDSILLINQQGMYSRSLISFNRLINQPLSTEFVIAPGVDLESLPNQQLMLEEARRRNPDLILAKLDQLSTALQIKSVKSVLYPKLQITAAYNYNFSKAEVGFLLSNQTYGPSSQLTFTYDIFSGRNLKNELQNIELIQGNLQKDQQRIELEIESRIADLYANYQILQNLRVAEEKEIRITAQNTLLANELYRYGRNTSFEVREAVLREIQAKNRLIQYTYQMKYIEVQVMAIAGLLQ